LGDEEMENQANLDYTLNLEESKEPVRAKQPRQFSDGYTTIKRRVKFSDRVVQFVEPKQTDTIQIDTTTVEAVKRDQKEILAEV
jgi:hypothetical protein